MRAPKLCVFCTIIISYSCCRNWKEQALGPGRARETTEAAQSSAQVESAEDRGGGNRKTKQQSSSTSINTSEPNTVPGDLTKHRSFCSSNKDSESRQCKDEPEPATSTPDPGTPVIVVTESKDHGEGMASHSQPQDNSERVAEKLEAEEELGEMGDQQIEKEEKKKEEEMDKEEMMAEKEAGKRKSIKVKNDVYLMYRCIHCSMFAVWQLYVYVFV